MPPLRQLIAGLAAPFALVFLLALSGDGDGFVVPRPSGNSAATAGDLGCTTCVAYVPAAFNRIPLSPAFAAPTPGPTSSATHAVTPPAKPAPSPTISPTPDPSAEYDTRFGAVGFKVPGHDGKAILDALRIYSHYTYSWGEPVAGKERLQMVGRSEIDEEGLDDFIRSHPGLYWQIGNEPNVPNQDAQTPTEYARKYFSWLQRIKNLDPTARFLPAGIANWPDAAGSPGAAVQYLRDFREAYRSTYGAYPPVDVWNVHAFPPFYYANGKLHSYCNTTEPKRYILEFVQYIRISGEQQPIWLTEFGMDWADDSDPCTKTFMIEMVRWLQSVGVVDRWYWWQINSKDQLDNRGGSLVDLNGNLTELGRTWRDLASEHRH